MADRKTTARTGSSATTPAKGPTPSAKEAKAAAKQAKAAAKQRRKTTTDPAQMGRFRQIGQAYKVTREFDPRLPYVLLAAFLVPIALAVVVGLLVGGLLRR